MSKKKPEQRKHIFALGVDPGSNSACCLIDAVNLRILRLANLVTDAKMQDILDVIKALAIDKETCCFFVEDQFAKGFGFKLNIKSLVTQVVNRAKWQNAAELLGFDCQFVQPSLWRSVAYIGSGKHTRDEWKPIAANFAERTLKEQLPEALEILTEHAAEALGIAWYGAMKLRSDNPSILQKKATVKKKVDKRKKI